jgi:hypothetical protein
VVDTVKFENWNDTCVGKTALTAYRHLIATFNSAWDNPFSNGDDIAQEVAYLRAFVTAGMASPNPAEILPPGCHPYTGKGAISLPKACLPLLNYSPSAPTSASEAAISSVLQPDFAAPVNDLITSMLANGLMPVGRLTPGSPVVRFVPQSGIAPGVWPLVDTPGYGPRSWVSQVLHDTVAFHQPVAVIWSCIRSALAGRSASGKTTTEWLLKAPDGSPMMPSETVVSLRTGQVLKLWIGEESSSVHQCGPAF